MDGDSIHPHSRPEAGLGGHVGHEAPNDGHLVTSHVHYIELRSLTIGNSHYVQYGGLRLNLSYCLESMLM